MFELRGQQLVEEHADRRTPKSLSVEAPVFLVEIASAIIALYLFDEAAAAIALFAEAAVLLWDLLLEGETQYCRHCKSLVRDLGRGSHDRARVERPV